MKLVRELAQAVIRLNIVQNNCAQLRYIHRPVRKLKKDPEEAVECLKPAKKPPKKSIWNIFKGKKEAECYEAEKKADTNPVKPVPDEQIVCDLKHISNKMGGDAYRTCGTAYILQTGHVEMPNLETDPETKILEDMVKDPSLKGQVDPMPPFESAEKRLIDLSERKLHPLYKRLMSIPKPPKPQPVPALRGSYKTRSGPVSPSDIPERLKLNKEAFEKKNIFCEFKKAHPPQQLMARLVEMNQNRRGTMEKKIEEMAKTDCSN
ncbi:uncharacterized protein LOC115876056 [Sitophilus oryzae]|uniref:Uncharacterized protein LOC115876056 n=1 Tax=Sitophilus oryzae TaxID=7048 RepID=A0A6J2X8S2_SITOR|nr:uncharacterized protein LOC115876056 [Sitophilus oryzae]